MAKETKTEWERMEELFGITIERPDADNRTIAQEANREEPEVIVMVEAPPTSPKDSRPRRLKRKTSRPSRIEREEMVQRQEEVYRESVPSVPDPVPVLHRDAEDPVPVSTGCAECASQKEALATSVQEQPAPAQETLVEKRGPESSERNHNVNRSVLAGLRAGHRLGEAKRGIVWAEIIQPPLARRRRR